MNTLRLIRGLFCLLSICIIVSLGCGGDGDKSVGPSVTLGASNLFPTERATGVPVVSSFSWTYADTSSGQIQYDLYLGTTDPPPIYRARLTDTTVVVGPLMMNSEYFWRIVAYDLGGDSVASIIWRFTTASSFEFPAAVGNTWDYYYSYIETYRDKAGINAVDTMTGSSVVEIAGIDTLSDTVETTRFYTSWDIGFDSGEANEYRLIRDGGMYLYAYDNGWSGPPKMAVPGDVYYEFKGMRFGSIEELMLTIRTACGSQQKSFNPALIIEDPPVEELVYPLAVGRQWMYRNANFGHVFDIQKEIIGIDAVSVPAGDFECYVIRWSWDIDDDGAWDTDIEGYDYLSGAGTAKRVFRYLGILVTDYTGSVIATADVDETFELVGFELHAPPAE